MCVEGTNALCPTKRHVGTELLSPKMKRALNETSSCLSMCKDKNNGVPRPLHKQRKTRQTCLHVATTQEQQPPSLPRTVKLPGAAVYYAEHVIDVERGYSYFERLFASRDWKRQSLVLFGKHCIENRQTSSYSLLDHTLNYRYSGRDNVAYQAPDIYKEIQDIVETWCLNNVPTLFSRPRPLFNFVLCNLYRNGSDNIGLHSDDESSLEGPIAAISLGATRAFDFRGKNAFNGVKTRLRLAHGSLLIMAGETQKHYKHGIPTEKRIPDPRISLTFRYVTSVSQRRGAG